ncbi:hypothetical protein G6M89_16625 [Natronolimnobius sp. AArcel1]|uniref:hypothetical protein n=1 Tax=Natronolimnobius sp. AArcel1 TaxID=1679093 RepID=UPI0013E9A9ED|nr:hypothetical protein [Natronolimnobius sp. AArcel1]NGM70608.1 hypothetical protein [Natronolimnobius sp. AArcel1]
MATQSFAEPSSSMERAVESIQEYAIVAYPLLAGLSLIVLGLVFQAVGRGTEAGVSAASGLIICAITIFVYGLFWALGRYGH